MRIISLSVLLSSLVLSSCARTSVSSATLAITATPTLNNRTIILTPDDLFSLPSLKALSTPDSENFCEHLPPPQIIANPDRLSILSGRFVLCPWESWPWVTNTAIDLDTASFVPKDDARADLVMQNGHATIDGAFPPFSVHSLNTAQVDEVTTDALNEEYCRQNLLRLFNNKIQSVLIVHDNSMACIKTTEGKIALIRVEEIFPPNTLSVEFSFALLRNE